MSGARAAGLVIALAAGAGACASNITAGSGGSGSPTASSSAPPSGAAASPSAASAGASGAASGSAAGAHSSAECSAAHLTITTADAGAGAGHEGVRLLFKNTGSTSCFMQGYPGAALRLPGGGTLNAQRTMNGYLGGDEVDKSPPYVTVAPGGTVSALLEWSDVPLGSGQLSSADCSGFGATGLLVTAPDQQVSASLGALGYVCEGFEIHPVIPIVANALQPSSGT